MAIGIHQPGGILNVFDITPFLKVIWQLNIESNPRNQWFYFSFLCDWFRKVKLLTQLIRSKGKTNHVLVVLVFLRFRLFVRLYFEFWLLRVSSFLVIGRISFIALNRKALLLRIQEYLTDYKENQIIRGKKSNRP